MEISLFWYEFNSIPRRDLMSQVKFMVYIYSKSENLICQLVEKPGMEGQSAFLSPQLYKVNIKEGPQPPDWQAPDWTNYGRELHDTNDHY